jgi:hypothetical protein
MVLELQGLEAAGLPVPPALAKKASDRIRAEQNLILTVLLFEEDSVTLQPELINFVGRNFLDQLLIPLEESVITSTLERLNCLYLETEVKPSHAFSFRTFFFLFLIYTSSSYRINLEATRTTSCGVTLSHSCVTYFRTVWSDT